jgi:hypothetical protein
VSLVGVLTAIPEPPEISTSSGETTQ